MKRGPRKTVVGTVTSEKMDKTITVEVQRRVQHPRFRKYIRAYTRLKAHDANNEAHEGDTVLIMETRPLSKTKRWRLVEIVRRTHGADIHTEAPPELEPEAAPEPEAAEADAQGAETAS